MAVDLARVRDAVRARFEGRAEIAVVLGSGHGAFADRVENPESIDYADLDPDLAPRVAGHAGRLVVGSLGGRRVAVFAGRLHMYEGRGADEAAFPALAAEAIGAKRLVLTTSCGALHPDWQAGDIALIADHINLMGDNPLAAAARRGIDLAFGGTPFAPMENLYDTSTLDALSSPASQPRELVLSASEGSASGYTRPRVRLATLAAVLGPIYETRAEQEMLRRLGADVVCMSTAPEATAARALGMRVAALGLVTNVAGAGATEDLTHAAVLAAATRHADAFAAMLEKLVAVMA
ncbi:purine-nucleoside phosphorylase [bacterium]|nr:purine-nucleoside phosphorylase [bacterium]